MQKKYFFLDIDGTLTTGLTAVMPDSAMRCLEKLRENGHFTAIATGRLQASAAVIAARYGFDDFIADGGYSLTLGGKLAGMRGLPVGECISLLDRLCARGVPWAVTIENKLACITSDKRYLPYAPEEYFTVSCEPSFDYHQIRQFYKVYVACTREQEQSIDFGDLTTVRYRHDLLFVEPTRKQEGIRRVLGLLGAADEDVVVFGDGTNDLCMFGQGWLSVAMGNACDELKQKADYITTPVDRDGLWNACKHFGFI